MSEILTKAEVAPGFSPAPAALKGGSTTEVIPKVALRELAKEWIAQGKVVAGPVQTKPGLVLYAPFDFR